MAYGSNFAFKEFDLAGSTIIYQMKMEDELRIQKNKENKITIYKGPKPKYADIDNIQN